MFGPMFPPQREPSEAPVSDAAEPDEFEKVWQDVYERLRHLGLHSEDAEVLAGQSDIAHKVEDLIVKKGCPAVLAARILWPL